MDTENDSKRLRHLTRGSRVGVSLAAAAAVMLTVFTGASPASAEASLVVSPSTNLDPAGAFVVVSGYGFEPNSQLFVMQCRSTSTDDHTCNSVGLRKVTTDASGSFTANAMRLVGRFGATDCTTTTCSVMTSAVSQHSDNRSQDRAAPISFAAPAPAPTEPAPAPAPTQAPPAPAPAPAPDVQSDAPVAPPEAGQPSAGEQTPPTEATTTTTSASSTTEAEADGEPRSLASDDRDEAADDEDGVESGDEVALSGATSDAPGGSSGGSGPLVAIGSVAVVAALGGTAFALQRRRSPASS